MSEVPMHYACCGASFTLASFIEGLGMNKKMIVLAPRPSSPQSLMHQS